ncbi:MAG: hypothetical protein ACRDY6_09485 [Acidimicrobiia bacterium]
MIRGGAPTGGGAGGSKEFVTVTDDDERGVVTFNVTGPVCGPLGVHGGGTPGSPAVKTHSYATDVTPPAWVSVSVHVPEPSNWNADGSCGVPAASNLTTASV